MLDSFGINKKDGKLVHWNNGYDKEQINWFKERASVAKTPHKFFLSHGPMFSPERWPVDLSAMEIWDSAQNNGFDLFFAAHEHIYSRWTIQTVSTPPGHEITQIVSGTSGAKIDSLDSLNVKRISVHAHPNINYNFVVVDVGSKTIITRTYAVLPKAKGGYETKLVDTFKIEKE